MSSNKTKSEKSITSKFLNLAKKPFTYNYKEGNVVTKNGIKYTINRVPYLFGADYNLLTENRTRKIKAKKKNFELVTKNIDSTSSQDTSQVTGSSIGSNIGSNQDEVIGSSIKSNTSSKRNMIKQMIKTNDYFDKQPINIGNINSIIETAFGNYNNNNKRVIHNIISNVLNKKNISKNEVTIINNIITRIFSGINDNSRKSKLIYYSTLIFLIDKIHLIKFDEDSERATLKSSILEKINEKNVDSQYIKNYINLYGNEKNKNFIPGKASGNKSNNLSVENSNNQNKELNSISEKELNSSSEIIYNNKQSSNLTEKLAVTKLNQIAGNPNATLNTPKNISNIKKDNILLIKRIIMKEKYPQIDDTMNKYIKEIDEKRIVNGKKPKKNTLNYLFQVLGYYEKDGKKSVILFENYYKIIFELNIDTLKDLIPYIHIHKSNNINENNVLNISRLPNEFKKIIKEENGKYIITSNNENYNLKNNFNTLNKNLGLK
jgi:hypothetical protein